MKSGKQVAQQEAERAKYEVEQARQSKKSTIIKAEASAKSIELVGKASMNNPCTRSATQLIWRSEKFSTQKKSPRSLRRAGTRCCLTMECSA